MTPRTLFNIILKVIGILFFQHIVALLPQIASIIIALKYNEVDEAIWTLSFSLLCVGVYWLIAYYLIFKTELVIDKFSLDKGFTPEPIPLNIHRSTILSISIIIIGALILTDEIPNLIRQIYAYFQERRLTQGYTTPKPDFIIMTGVKIIIGLILIGNQKQLVNYIEFKRKG